MNRLLSVLIILSTSSIYAPVVIWDIGDVLFSPNKFDIAKKVGLSNFIGYALVDRQNPRNLEPLVFDILSSIPCAPLADNCLAYATDTQPLPPIMCHWQAGTYSHHEILSLFHAQMKLLDQEGYFITRREKELVTKLVTHMFDPLTLACMMRPNKPVLGLMKACAHAKDMAGKPKNYLIALSNWDPVSFDLFYKRYKHDLNHFDVLSISGKTGLIKPRAAAYEHLIHRYKINPADCIVIDDQQVNLSAARQLGCKTFHVKRNNHRALRTFLRKHNAL